MSKSTLLAVFGMLAFLISAVVYANYQNPSTPPTADQTASKSTAPQSVASGEADIFYWGETCPYCHDTIAWMEDNAVESVLPIVRKEVYNNRQNSQELVAASQQCGIPEGRIGVPLLFTTGGDCLIGQPDITSYLQDKLSTSSSE